MRKNLIWLLVSCVVILSLVLASCAPATPVTPPTTTPPTTTPPTTTPPTTTPPTAEVPKYGGTVVHMEIRPNRGFDDHYQLNTYVDTCAWTNDELLTGDWSRGPAGTKELTFANEAFILSQEMGSMAESYEIVDANTIVLHIRQGVHWGLNPNSEASRLVNGRQLTAEDVAYNIRSHWTVKQSWLAVNFPGWLQSAEVTSPWTVTVKGNDNVFKTALVWMRLSDYMFIYPPEVIQKYGSMQDWRNSVGTGPFMLVDSVSGSSSTVIRNPNYWMTDPVGPGKGNQLPYPDRAVVLYIIDPSTQQAAVRTGKVDRGIIESGYDDAMPIIKSNPALQWFKKLPGTDNVIFMRVDRKPFDDIRVRKAMSMAIDYDAIVNDFCSGDAVKLFFEVPPDPIFGVAYVPFDQLPADTKDHLTYQPDKAKKLLTEAGYPNGFKLTMPCISPTDIDIASVFVAYWKAIGVDVTLQPVVESVHTSIKYGKTYENIIFSGRGVWTPDQFLSHVPGHQYNQSVVDDPYINERYPVIWDVKNIGKDDIRMQALKEVNLRALSQAYWIQVPLPYAYTIWWPWLKNHHGEASIGTYNHRMWVRYCWIDQELKKKMGY